jgi:hypothetical protein
VDHASSYIHVEHKFGFSGVETIRAKQSHERMCLDNRVFVQDYLTDSGAFKEKSLSNISMKHVNFCVYVVQMHIIKMELLKGLFRPSAIW